MSRNRPADPPTLHLGDTPPPPGDFLTALLRTDARDRLTQTARYRGLR